jgi:hypothetical protein
MIKRYYFIRMILCSACLLALAFEKSVLAQDVPELIAVQAKIEAEVREKVEKPHEALVKDLQSRYSAAVDREQQAAEKAGKTDEALLLKAEKAALAAEQPIPSTDDEKTPVVLKKLRTTYRVALLRLERDKTERLKPYIDAMQREADALAMKLTKESRLADAEAVQSAGARFAIQFSPAAVIGVGGTVLPFENGQKSYANRFFIWENVPVQLSGLKFVQTSGGSPVMKEVRVKEPGTIYIGVFADNAPDAETLTKLGFVKLSLAFNSSDSGKTPMAVFAKVSERSVNLPPSNAFSGFVVIGDVR